MNHFETIENVPAGICACKVNGLDVTVINFSKEHVLVRFSDNHNEKAVSIEFDCFFWHKNGFVHFGPFEGNLEETVKKEYCFEISYLIDNPEFKEMVESVSKQLGEYVKDRLEACDNSFSNKLVQYPAKKDEDFEKSYEDWFRKKSEEFSVGELKTFLQSLNCEIAVSLENPDLWNSYLAGKTEFFFSRIYVGNAFCHILRPDFNTLKRILEKAHGDGIEATIVLSYLREELIDEEISYIDEILSFCSINGFSVEFEINDYGFIEILKARGVKFSLGRLLCKRRKDPRIKYKDRIRCFYKELESNSYNDEDFLDKLKGLGLERVEMESPGYKILPPDIVTSIHLPFYQTNTSQFCPLQALLKQKDRGYQVFNRDCKRECLKNNVLYANHLSLVGRYNSIFALDTWIIKNPDVLREYLNHGTDRLVWNWGFDYDNNSRNGDH